jgi:hypothetical protein
VDLQAVLPAEPLGLGEVQLVVVLEAVVAVLQGDLLVRLTVVHLGEDLVVDHQVDRRHLKVLQVEVLEEDH